MQPLPATPVGGDDMHKVPQSVSGNKTFLGFHNRGPEDECFGLRHDFL